MADFNVEQQWTSRRPTIKFIASYECKRNDSGAAVYNLSIKIQPLLSTGSYYGYNIKAQAWIKVGNASWGSTPNITWQDGSAIVTSKTLKGIAPNYWSSSITHTSKEASVSANPGDNVQIKLRLYSDTGGGTNYDYRDEVYTYSNLSVPAPKRSEITSVTDLSVTNIPRATISANIYNTSNAHNLKVYMGSSLIAERGTGTSQAITWTGSASPYTYTLTLSGTEATAIKNAMPVSESGMLTYTLTTYNSAGSAVFGSFSKQGGCSIPDTSANKPTVSATSHSFAGAYTPEGGSTAYYIQGETTLNITSVTCLPTFTVKRAGALLSHYVVRVTTDGIDVDYRRDSSPSVGDPWVIPLPAAGNTTIRVYAYDTRGRSAYRNVDTVFVQPYHPPYITDYTTTRCTDMGDDDPSGEYFHGVVNTDISSFSQYHTVTLTNSGFVSIAYVKYNNEQYYDAGDVITGIPDGATLTIHVEDPESFGETMVVVDGETVADNAGGLYYQDIEYEMAVTRDLSITFDINAGSNCSIIVASSPPLNKPEIKIDYKPTTATQWVEGSWVTFSGTKYISSAMGAGNIAQEQSYDIRYTIRDVIYTSGISVEDYLSSAQFTLFLAKGGKAISVGEIYAPAEGSAEKVLNISNDWEIRRGAGGTGGGVTPPYVVEQGWSPSSYVTVGNNQSNRIIWTYRKWNNGFCELWGVTEEITITGGNSGDWNPWGNGLYLSGRFTNSGQEGTVTGRYKYPFDFVDNPHPPCITATMCPTNAINGFLVTASNADPAPSVLQYTPRYFVARTDNPYNLKFKLSLYITGYAATTP